MTLKDKAQSFGVKGIGYWYSEDSIAQAIKKLKGHLSRRIWKDDCNYIPWDLFLEELDKIFGDFDG